MLSDTIYGFSGHFLLGHIIPLSWHYLCGRNDILLIRMCSEITLQCRISICREQFHRAESEERRNTANNVEEWASVLTEA